jgi:hypothetical protein
MMYEPSLFRVEDRDALFVAMYRQDADKLGVFNGLSADPESRLQAMASLVKTYALGGSA